MKNFFINDNKNNINIYTPVENNNETKIMYINKMIIKLNDETKTFFFNLIYLDSENSSVKHHEIISYEINYNNFSQSRNKIVLTNKNKQIKISFSIHIEDNFFIIDELEVNFKSNELILDDLYINYNQKIVYKSLEVEKKTKRNMYSFDDVIKFNIVPCQYIKIYVLSNIQPPTFELNYVTKTSMYSHLICVKTIKEYPIELNDEDFSENLEIQITTNAELYVTDENNNPLDIKNIILFYNIN